jgi:hypothetical protein
MSRLSDRLVVEIEKILLGLRQDLQLELYSTIGYHPKEAFYSNQKFYGAFYNEAGKFLSLEGRTESDVEQFCSGNMHFGTENLKRIEKIATLALVQLAMW